MIELTDVSAGYGQRLVLKGICKAFHDGNIYGVIGLNGAGKTTLFNVLAGTKGYSGSIKHSYNRNNPIRKEVAMLPTAPYFFPKSLGEEYLAFIKYAKGGAAASDRNNLFNIPLKNYVSSYSSGMKKKIAFTGLLIGTHEAYILDEPFNDADIIGNVIMKKEIMKLKESGKIVLLSSHILSSLTDICDEILLLCEGDFKKSFQKKKYNFIENHLLNL